MLIFRNLDCLHLPPGGAERFVRMIGQQARGTLTVRLRIDPLPPSLFDAVLDRGDMSRVHMFAELDEQADDILLVIREPEPETASRTRRRLRMGELTYPHLLTIAIDEESGGVVIRSLPDTHLSH